MCEDHRELGPGRPEVILGPEVLGQILGDEPIHGQGSVQADPL